MSQLTITGYSDEQFQTKAPAPNEYVAMLNPEKIERNASISYSDGGSDGALTSGRKFVRLPCQSLSFELVLDCTGIVDQTRTDLKAELDKLFGVVYDYKSAKHRSNFLNVKWGGTLNFNGVLTSIGVNYTFFKPDGTALRARVSLKFDSYIDPATEAKKNNDQSPDVTHHVVVREGDSLPLIAARIYGSPDYFVALAKANRLNKFRRLTPGSTLLSPPLKSSGGQHG